MGENSKKTKSTEILKIIIKPRDSSMESLSAWLGYTREQYEPSLERKLGVIQQIISCGKLMNEDLM